MADDFKIKIITDDFQEGIAGGGAGGGTGGGGSAVGLGAKLGIGISIATSMLGLLDDVVGSILKPVQGLVKGIFKLVGELLRPIADIMIIVLKPIMQLVKPLINMFRTMMAPFMGIAREMSMISQEQMAGGDTTGAMQTAMEAFKTIIGPFIVSASSIFLQLATSMLVTNLTNLFGTVISVLFEPLAMIAGFFSEDIANKIRAAGETAKEYVVSAGNSIIETTNGFILNVTEGILASMLVNAKEKLEDMKETYGEDLNTIHKEIPDGVLEEQKKITLDGMNVMTAETKKGFDDMGLTTQTKMTNIDSTLSKGLSDIESTFQSFVDSLKSIAEDFPSGGKGESERKEKKWSLDSFTIPLGPFGPRIGFGRG